MKNIIFILIAVGLIWNSQNYLTNSFDKTKETMKLNTLSGELLEETFSDNQDDDREFSELDYLALNSMCANLIPPKLRIKAFDHFTLLSSISPAFTTPPDLS